MSSRFPTYPPDILSRADALLSEKYGTDKPIDPLLVEIACEAMMMEQEHMAALLKDPAAVRVNYLRGGIACQKLIDEAVEAETERCAKLLEEGFDKPVAEAYRNDGQSSKNDKCPHDRYMYEDCEACAAKAIRGTK